MVRIGIAGCSALLTVILAISAIPAMAEESGGTGVNSGDTTWVMISAALVMLMTPAVGLFYGGMVRKKNVIAIITQSFVILALVSIQWILLGYTLAFGHDAGGLGLIGGWNGSVLTEWVLLPTRHMPPQYLPCYS